MDADLDTLATALYATTDDLLKAHPDWVPARPRIGFTPKLTDAELITLAVMQVLLRFNDESRWIRYAGTRLRHLFPYVLRQPGYNKRLRKLAPTMARVMRALAQSTSVWTDDVWVVDSTPIECARSRETVQRSDLAGFAEYGYCASHSRYFWGLRLHLIATLHGLPIGFLLTAAKTDERHALLAMLEDPDLARPHPQILIADQNYYGTDFETTITTADLTLLRPTRKGEQPRPGQHFFKPLRQTIESIIDTGKGQLGLEQHGGHTPTGVITRILQRLLALTAAIWHNDHTNTTTLRTLTPYDH